MQFPNFVSSENDKYFYDIYFKFQRKLSHAVQLTTNRELVDYCRKSEKQFCRGKGKQSYLRHYYLKPSLHTNCKLFYAKPSSIAQKRFVSNYDNWGLFLLLSIRITYSIAIFVWIVALGRHQLWTRSLAENDRIGKAQAEEGDSLLINHLLISKATLTNKIMICLL